MHIFKKKRVFLDFASATPLSFEVKKEMKKFETKNFYNPSAIYAEGLEAKRALESFRMTIARILHAGSKDIIFTSGGTEGDNLAVLGVFEKAKENPPAGGPPHIIISELEHPAIKEAAKEAERRGAEVSVVEADKAGMISAEKVMSQVKETTILVSISLASGETGAIQPVPKIGRLLREYRKRHASPYPYFHIDATAAAGYLSLNVDSLHGDLLTIDSAKLYGPKGCGALVIRPGVSLYPISFGGGHERGLRSGTPSLPLIAGFSKALEIADGLREKEAPRLARLRDELAKGLGKLNNKVRILGSGDNFLPHILGVFFENELSEFMAIKLDQKGILVSAGPACSSQKNGGDELAVRFSLGRTTTKKDIQLALKALSEIVLD